MRYLIDTHCFLWHFLSAERLSAAARDVLSNPDADLWFSTASIWEIVIKEGMLRAYGVPMLWAK